MCKKHCFNYSVQLLFIVPPHTRPTGQPGHTVVSKIPPTWSWHSRQGNKWYVSKHNLRKVKSKVRETGVHGRGKGAILIGDQGEQKPEMKEREMGSEPSKCRGMRWGEARRTEIACCGQRAWRRPRCWCEVTEVKRWVEPGQNTGGSSGFSSKYNGKPLEHFKQQNNRIGFKALEDHPKKTRCRTSYTVFCNLCGKKWMCCWLHRITLEGKARN